jgi:hypothetical protein
MRDLIPSRRATWHRAIAALAIVAALSACGEEDVPTGIRPNGTSGRVRFVHAVADPARADRVNVTVENVPLTANLAFGAVAPVAPTATYYPVLTGSRLLAVRRTADTTVKVLDQPLTISENVDYTVMAVGNAAGVSGVVLTDDNTVPTAGNVKLRAVHAAPSSGAVDVYITSPAGDITTTAPQITNLAFRGGSTYLSLPAAAYRVRFTPTGTKAISLDVTISALASGAIRTVVALDRAQGGAPLTSATLTDR